VYEIDPMICPHCGGEMKIIAVIQDTKEIKKIGFYMLPRQFFFVYPPQHLRSGITFPIIKRTLHCNGADSSCKITAGESLADLQLVLYGKKE
jgi:hypothetical protein